MATIARTVTFTDGTTAYGSEVETEIDTVFDAWNAHDGATSTWTNVKGATIEATTVLKGKGTATNDSATAGYIGEYVSASQATATNFPATGTYGDGASISLTAGDWDVSAVLLARQDGATWTSAETGISSTSGNSGTGLVNGDNRALFSHSSSSTTPTFLTMTIASFRVSLSATTTYYQKVQAGYSAGQATYQCRISARRVR